MYRRRGSSNQFLKLVEEAGHLGFWSFDVASDEMLGSPAVARIAGLPPSGDPRVIFNELIHPADRAAQADLYDFLRSGRSFERTYRIIRTDRTLRWIKVRADIILGSGDVPVRVEGIVFDVTELEQTRQQSEESQARYHGLLQAIEAIIWTASAEGHYRPNMGWQALTGQLPEDMRDDGWLLAIHEQDRDRMTHAWQTALTERSRLKIEVDVVSRIGQMRRFSCHGTPLLNEDGTVREWIGAMLPVGGDPSDTPFEFGSAFEAGGALGRAGRALLGWSMAELASRAQISVASVKRFEDPLRTISRPKIRQAILTALTQAGVAFDRNIRGVPTVSLQVFYGENQVHDCKNRLNRDNVRF